MKAVSLKKYSNDPSALLGELAPHDVLLLLDPKDVPCYAVVRIPDAALSRNSFIADVIRVADKYAASGAALPAPSAPAFPVNNGGSEAAISQAERALFSDGKLWDFYASVVRPIYTHGNDPAVRIYATRVPDLRVALNKHGGVFGRLFVRKGYVRLKLTVGKHNVAATGQPTSNSWPDQITVNLYPNRPLPPGLADWVQIAHQEALNR